MAAWQVKRGRTEGRKFPYSEDENILAYDDHMGRFWFNVIYECTNTWS